MKLESLRSCRIGIVFSGGGAKGAYQIGCWQVLRKLQISNLTAVSGSSVGALNSVLAALGKFETASSLWRNLRFGTIVGFRPSRTLLLPFWLVIAVYRLREVPIRGRQDPAQWGRALLFAAWVPVTYLYGVCVVTAHGTKDFVFLTVIWSLVFLFNVLTFCNGLVKRILLNWVATTNTPLARILATEVTDKDRLAIPAYATLSRYHPEIRPDALFWLDH
jgi:Patatin-like phospholipase